MPENRFFISSHEPLERATELVGHEFKHLLVMRPKVGEIIVLVDGKGYIAQAQITHLSKQKAEFIIQCIDFQKPPSFELIIAQSLPRLNKLDFILEKGTELGMTELMLFPGEASDKITVSEHQQKRMQNILIASLKQCGRLYLPKISYFRKINTWKTTIYPIFFGDVRSNAKPFIYALKDLNSIHGLIFVVGSEKGFTSDEIHHLESIGAQGVSLNSHVLRTETAPLVALSIASHLLISKNSA